MLRAKTQSKHRYLVSFQLLFLLFSFSSSFLLANEWMKTGWTQASAILIELSATKGAVRCIQKYGLDKEFPPDELIKQISKLQEKRMSLKSSAPLRPSMNKQQQLAELPEEVTRKRSALAAGIITQPTQPSPLLLPARNVKGTRPPLHTKFPRL